MSTAAAPTQTAGELVFTAYAAALGERGRPAPTWAQLDTHHRRAFESAATALVRTLQQSYPFRPPAGRPYRRHREDHPPCPSATTCPTSPSST